MGKFSEKLVKGSLYSFMSMVGVNIVTLVYSILLARMLVTLHGDTGIEYLGIFSLMREIGQILLPFLMLGITTAMAKFIPEYQVKDPSKLNILINSGIYLVTISAVFGGIAYFLLADMIAINIFDTPLLGTLMKVNALFIIFTVLMTTLQGILQGFQKIKLLAKLNFLTALIAIPLLIIFISRYSITGVIIAGVINAVVSTIIIAYFVQQIFQEKKFNFKFKLDKGISKSLLQYSSPIIMSVIILRPSQLFGRAYLAIETDWLTVGFYKIGFTFYGLLLFVPAAISIPLLPMISELDARRPDLRAAVSSRIIKIGMFIILPLGILAALLSEFFIWALFGEAYIPATDIVMLMVITALVSSFFSIVGSIMLGTGKTMQLLYIDICNAVMFVILAYFLINTYGLAGLGWAWVIVPIVLIGPYIYYLYKNDYILLKPIGEALFVTAFFIPLVFMTHFYWQDYLLVMLVAIMGPLIIIEYLLLSDRDKKLIGEIKGKLLGKLG
jgi:O-antigen/teichoic acid export membrane protein